MAAKGKSWLGEFWRPLAALLLWVLGMVPLIAAPTLPSLAETRIGGLQPIPQVIAPAELLLSLDLHRACGPPLYDVASGCSVAAKSGGGLIDPATVRFSQDSIKGTFKAGGSVDDLAAGLKAGTIKPGDIPAIRLVDKDGVLYSLDNRRLQAFQQAGVPIPYRMATPEEVAAEAFKFTTENGGTSIRVRGK